MVMWNTAWYLELLLGWLAQLQFRQLGLALALTLTLASHHRWRGRRPAHSGHLLSHVAAAVVQSASPM